MIKVKYMSNVSVVGVEEHTSAQLELNDANKGYQACIEATQSLLSACNVCVGIESIGNLHSVTGKVSVALVNTTIEAVNASVANTNSILGDASIEAITVTSISNFVKKIFKIVYKVVVAIWNSIAKFFKVVLKKLGLSSKRIDYAQKAQGNMEKVNKVPNINSVADLKNTATSIPNIASAYGIPDNTILTVKQTKALKKIMALQGKPFSKTLFTEFSIADFSSKLPNGDTLKLTPREEAILKSKQKVMYHFPTDYFSEQCELIEITKYVAPLNEVLWSLSECEELGDDFIMSSDKLLELLNKLIDQQAQLDSLINYVQNKLSAIGDLDKGVTDFINGYITSADKSATTNDYFFSEFARLLEPMKFTEFPLEDMTLIACTSASWLLNNNKITSRPPNLLSGKVYVNVVSEETNDKLYEAIKTLAKSYSNLPELVTKKALEGNSNDLISYIEKTLITAGPENKNAVDDMTNVLFKEIVLGGSNITSGLINTYSNSVEGLVDRFAIISDLRLMLNN